MARRLPFGGWRRSLLLLLLCLVRELAAAPAAVKNPYDVLQISRGADEATIKKAYKRMALKYHPDKNTGAKKEAAAQKFSEISNAYEILSDSDKRRNYDQFGHPDGPQMGGPGYGGPHPGYRQYAHHHGRGGFPGGGGFGGFGFGGFGFGQPPPIESETKTVTVHQLLAMLEKRQPVVVQVFHDASDACVRFAPVWDATARAMDGAAAFVRVDGNADGRLAHQLAQHPALSAMVGGARLAISELPVVVGFTGRCGASLACAHRFRGERSGAALAGFAAGWLVAALPRLPLLDVKGLKAFLAANRDKTRVVHLQQLAGAADPGAPPSHRQLAQAFRPDVAFARVAWRREDSKEIQALIGHAGGAGVLILREGAAAPQHLPGSTDRKTLAAALSGAKVGSLPRLTAATHEGVPLCSLAPAAEEARAKAKGARLLRVCFVLASEGGAAAGEDGWFAENKAALRAFSKKLAAVPADRAWEKGGSAAVAAAARGGRVGAAWAAGAAAVALCQRAGASCEGNATAVVVIREVEGRGVQVARYPERISDDAPPPMALYWIEHAVNSEAFAPFAPLGPAAAVFGSGGGAFEPLLAAAGRAALPVAEYALAFLLSVWDEFGVSALLVLIPVFLLGSVFFGNGSPPPRPRPQPQQQQQTAAQQKKGIPQQWATGVPLRAEDGGAAGSPSAEAEEADGAAGGRASEDATSGGRKGEATVRPPGSAARKASGGSGSGAAGGPSAAAPGAQRRAKGGEVVRLRKGAEAQLPQPRTLTVTLVLPPESGGCGRDAKACARAEDALGVMAGQFATESRLTFAVVDCKTQAAWGPLSAEPVGDPPAPSAGGVLLAWSKSRTRYCVLGEVHSDEGRKAAKIRIEKVLDGTGEWVQVTGPAASASAGEGGGGEEGGEEQALGWPALV